MGDLSFVTGILRDDMSCPIFSYFNRFMHYGYITSTGLGIQHPAWNSIDDDPRLRCRILTVSQVWRFSSVQIARDEETNMAQFTILFTHALLSFRTNGCDPLIRYLYVQFCRLLMDGSVVVITVTVVMASIASGW
jgi:hypothetical protein